MLMSRNPNGDIEAYDDLGQFIGILPPDYPGLDLQEFTEDGGPGSGNWGHHGRPGKRGGSGKGGGKQYRGGRSDVRFVGTRKDWMNGLTGDDQHRAALFIASKKRDVDDAVRQKKKIDSLWEKGIISYDEAEAYKEKHGLNQIRDDMTAEEYVMKCGSKDDREELLNHIAGGRKWKENAALLAQENWDENDNKLAAALADKYGAAGFADAKIPDDSNTKDWDQDDLAYWQDLKAKAMEIPTSGKEAPDELQYAAGLKERPAPPNPSPSGVPKTAEENAAWIESVDEDFQKDILKQLYDLNIDPRDFIGEFDLNSAERKFEARIVPQLATNSDEILKEYYSYLSAKDRALKAGIVESLAAGDTDRLTDEQKQNVKDILSLGLVSMNEDTLTEKNAGYAEFKMMFSNEVPGYVKAYYLGLKAHALGLEKDHDGKILLEEVYGDSAKAILPEVKQFILGKNVTRTEYASMKQKNAVVIQGDSFSEKINGMRSESGTYTAEEISHIGNEVYQEVSKSIGELNKKMDDLEKEKIDRQKEYRDVIKKYTSGESDESFWDEKDKAWTAYSNVEKEYMETEKALANSVVTTLHRIRKLGPENSKDMKMHLPGRSTVKDYVTDSYNLYPTEWIARSISMGAIKLKKVGRGYCGDDVIAISGYGDEARKTATHELGHRFEKAVPGILEAERDFYKKRTDGEKLRTMREVTGNARYRANERTKVDKFLNPYMGKDYNGSAYELVSMGFEMAFHRPQEIMKDQEYAHFIFGLLAVG